MDIDYNATSEMRGKCVENAWRQEKIYTRLNVFTKDGIRQETAKMLFQGVLNFNITLANEI